ncbi:MAG TPA: hypothetical protein VKZ89_20175 [Thermobifida alba]|nr:hypothetical protein [Thermobifida alba]
MTLPTGAEAMARSRDRTPFSNGTEGAAWMAAWCHRCVHDADARDMNGPGCPLVFVAIQGRTPAEWDDGPRDENGLYGLADQYQCTYFRDEDGPDGGGDPEPQPIPDPPGQEALLPRTGLEGARILTDHPTADRSRT